MLNDASKQGIREILSDLDDSTVISLAATVTTGLLKNKIYTRQEAITAVVHYSPDALSFLRRKNVTREILFSYVHKNKIPVNLPATKNDLVQKIASFWDIQYVQESAIDEINNGNQNDYSSSGSIEMLAQQFTEWFYTMYNGSECLNPEHFYPDAKLQINTSNGGEITSEIIENNAVEVAKKLFEIRVKYNLLFNPNLKGGGVQGKVEPHGLVLVLVCGTLHAEGACVGIFEQLFGLVRDPLTDNHWKIKTSQLNLKSQSGIVTLPTLEKSSLLTLTT